jgi:hypothetical protein
MKIIRTKKTAQDYGGYYSGEAPNYQGSYIGSPSVDISNVSSQFGDAQKSVDLVNKFDSGLLKNIVYMFNFAKSGVYGVYVPALDRAVKTKELEKRLRTMGYDIVEEDGMLRAYPTKEEKDQETIQREIQQVYDDLENKGGSVLGLNVSDTRREMEGSFNNIKDGVDPSMHNDLRNDLMIAHMAATMAHEATHAHGAEDEGGPTQVETALLNWAISEIAQKYQIQGELSLKRGGSDNWYKEAQSHFPLYPPAGSDLDGRHGGWDGNLQGQPDFGMMAQQYQNRAIEEMLGRQFQSPLPYDLSPEHDPYELQLRKYTREDWSLDPQLIFEELLRDSHTNDGSEYKTMEELLEDTRPKPLMMPIKQASRMTKEATVFGWYNNLEISDGSTIPGMGDRVMAWDDRDESFADYEGWIKSQPRYNPTYDVKGFYYRWIEPRFKPESWISYTRDYSNTHPAKRFASSNDLGFIVDTLRKIRTKILNDKLKATRFICSEDMLPVVGKSMDGCDIDIDIFVLGEMDGEEVYSCWIHRGVGSDNIEKTERCIQNNDEHLRDVMEKVVGTRSTLADSVSEIMDVAKDIAKNYEINDVYAIGSYAREISLGDSSPEVEELEFTSNAPTDSYKFGYMIAEKLGVVPEIDRNKKCLCFNYRGVQVYFNGGKRIGSVEKWMSKADIDSSSNIMHDVCNKDFTLNAKAYNPASGVVTSLFSDDDDCVKTVLKADDIVSFNPFIILRAIYLSARHNLPIDDKLEGAIKKYAPLLVEKYPVEMLQFAKVRIEELGKEEAQELFKKYELDTIVDFGE